MLPIALNAEIARMRERELRRVAAAPRLQPPARPPERAPDAGRATVTIRWAGGADIPALDRLARVDEAALPHAPTLVAERDGRILAALPLGVGAPPIADPFVRTAELVDLLELRAAQLARAERPARGSRRRRLHLPVRA